MSHSSGIEVSGELKDSFGAAKGTDRVRFFKVQIQNETQVAITQTENASGSWTDDFSKIQAHLKETEACYILYRLDSKNQLGYEWVLMSFVPDKAKVREKMTYASTKGTLKLTLGGGSFAQEYFGTIAKDFTLEAYNKWIAHQQAEAPLTQAERDRKEEEEQGVVVGGGGPGIIAGVAFPVDDQVIQQLKQLKAGSVTYVQLVIDTEKEKIISGGASKISIAQLADQFPNDQPRFHFFDFVHDFDGAQVHSIVYIYSCPDGSGGTKSAPVKQRMLYSSSKANVTNIATAAELQIATRLEVNKGSEVTEAGLMETIHPPKEEKKQAFSKPAKAGRGPARLVREKK